MGSVTYHWLEMTTARVPHLGAVITVQTQNRISIAARGPVLRLGLEPSEPVLVREVRARGEHLIQVAGPDVWQAAVDGVIEHVTNDRRVFAASGWSTWRRWRFPASPSEV